ncbi:MULTISPECIES: hydantoinase/oxoprolinase family protein [Pseudomonas]|uniref:hydantoinase/oxoprolinase family protein n=1 Tax=Pseudomonas TaxID=286 RepID=UPI00107ED723|nr:MULTISPECIES: hydantoinase/oxoprolinase family protein [Pseudomonas]TGB15432.1 hydantoinase/oxoprolinase family protein [Pseudomonas aeruginosa]BBR54615.1 methylhydantoinase [Pseudomonas putida]HCF1421228.1 hydantoinase/oxoprolinase family protein [Pseudomonas aeruginosa]
MRRIGVDTGGTFTDCLLIDDTAGVVMVEKVPSCPESPDKAIVQGVLSLTSKAGLAPSQIDAIVHGTTVATNVVIEGNYASTGLIATRGCRDVIEIGTQQRERLYDLLHPAKPSLITRDLRVEVAGRLAADGSEIEPVDQAEIERAVRALVEKGVESIAATGLFSFENPAHELAIAEVVRQVAPGINVMCSSMISREAREYPRFATTAVNAALAPTLDPYIQRLETALQGNGFYCPLYIMQSNGGVGTAARSVGEKAHHLVLSGPAGGVISGESICSAAGFPSLVTLDVGGTSADIGIVVDGKPRVHQQMRLPNGIPITVPNLEIETIGAGGGSIAWIDQGGALQVGPRSAGAVPGPACFRKGGFEPTVTDAQALLGRLNPAGLLGGSMALDIEAARQAIAGIAEKLDLGVEETALGIISLMEANMASAILRSAARNGDDLREFALVAAGGAGGFSVVGLARELNIPTVIIPPFPGLLSAGGLLAANLRHDVTAPLLRDAQALERSEIEQVQQVLEQDMLRLLQEDGMRQDQCTFEHALDMRYAGQEYAVTVPVTPGEAVPRLVEQFHALHERIYGHSAPGAEVEIVTARLTGKGAFLNQGDAQPSPQPARALGSRPVWFAETAGYVDTPVYWRSDLTVGSHFTGPAIVEQFDTTTVINPGFTGQVAASGCLIISETQQ